MKNNFEKQAAASIDRMNKYKDADDADNLAAENEALTELLETFTEVTKLLDKEGQKVFTAFVKKVTKDKNKLDKSGDSKKKEKSKKEKKPVKGKEKEKKSKDKSKDKATGKWWN